MRFTSPIPQYRDYVTVTPNGPLDGGDYGQYTPGTVTLGIQEALNSGKYALIQGNKSGGVGQLYDIGANQLIAPINRPWGMGSSLPSEGFVNTQPITEEDIGVTIKSSIAGDWLLTSPSASYATAYPAIIKDLSFLTTSSTSKGCLNLTYLEVQLKGTVSCANIYNANIASSVGIYMGDQGNNFMSTCDTIHVSGYDTQVIIARDNITIGYLNLGLPQPGHTNALQVGNFNNAPFNDGILINQMHIKNIGTGTVANVINSLSPLKQALIINNLVLEVGNNGVITNSLIKWGGGNSVNPHIFIGMLLDYDAAYSNAATTYGGLPPCLGVGAYSAFNLRQLNFRGVTLGAGWTALFFPTATGSANAKTNNSPLTIRIHQTGQVGTRIVAPGAAFLSAGDYLFPAGTDSTFDLPPGYQLYYTTTLPTSKLTFARLGREGAV